MNMVRSILAPLVSDFHLILLTLLGGYPGPSKTGTRAQLTALQKLSIWAR